jgi:hypothetical protein
MHNEKKIRELLVGNVTYAAALASADHETRKKIESTIEPALVEVLGLLDDIIEQVRNDPKLQEELGTLLDAERVVNVQPVTSGSAS